MALAQVFIFFHNNSICLWEIWDYGYYKIGNNFRPLKKKTAYLIKNILGQGISNYNPSIFQGMLDKYKVE